MKFLAREDCKKTDQDYVRRMTQETLILLKKQIESLIGFLYHKQEQYQSECPDIARQVDDQIRYITLSFDHLADTMEILLNEEISFEGLSQGIIDHMQL